MSDLMNPNPQPLDPISGMPVSMVPPMMPPMAASGAPDPAAAPPAPNPVAPPITAAPASSPVAPSMSAPSGPAGSAVAPAIGSTGDLENKGLAAKIGPAPTAVAPAMGSGDPQADFKKEMQDAKAAKLNTKIGSPEYFQARQKELDLKAANPWGSPGNHPGILGKIEHAAAKVGNIAGDIVAPGVMDNIPGTDRNMQRQSKQNLANYDKAETREENADAKEAKGAKSPWKPAMGEQYTKYDKATHAPISQLFTNEDTSAQEWRPVPQPKPLTPVGDAGGPPAAAAAGASVPMVSGASTPVAPAAPTAGAPSIAPTPPLAGNPAVAAPHEGAPLPNAGAGDAGSYYGSKEAPKHSEEPVGNGTAQYSAQVDSAAQRVPKGYDVAKPDITASDSNETAEAKLKDYHAAVNTAILADRNDKAQAARETAQESKERRTEERHDRTVTGYAENSDGQLVLTNKFDAGVNKQAFEEIKPGDVNKDKSAMRQLNDVQKNVNLYTKSLREDLPNLKPGDTDKMQEIMTLNQQGGGSVLDVGAKGVSIGSIPVLGAKLTKQNLKQLTDDLAGLSPAGRNLLTGYLRTAAAVPAYQKALTGIGRSNKEMLDLELANIPLPYYDGATANNRMTAFQDNMNQARSGFPSNLPGMKLTTVEAESGGGKPEGATHVGTSSLDNKPYYLDKDGKKLAPVTP